METVEIYINLYEDDAARPTQAIPLENNRYKVLPTADYDPEDEVWEFIPGSIVRCETRDFRGRKYLLAVESINEL